MNDIEFVAENIMDFERGKCRGTVGWGGTGDSGGFWCQWCGQRREYLGTIPPCPAYPFPEFSLVDLMRELGEKGMPLVVRYDTLRESRRFTIVGPDGRICDTDTPLESLCAWLRERYDG